MSKKIVAVVALLLILVIFVRAHNRANLQKPQTTNLQQVNLQAQDSEMANVPVWQSSNEEVRVVGEDISCFQPTPGKKTYSGNYYIIKDGFRYDFGGQKLDFSEGRIFDKKLYPLKLSSSTDLSFYAYYQNAGCNFSLMIVLRFTKGKGFDAEPLTYVFLDKTKGKEINDAEALTAPKVNGDFTFSASWYSNGDGKVHTQVWKYDEASNLIKEIKESAIIK